MCKTDVWRFTKIGQSNMVAKKFYKILTTLVKPNRSLIRAMAARSSTSFGSSRVKIFVTME